MKQYKILAILFAFALMISGCDDTNENLVGSRGIAIVPTISDINPAFYTTDLANSYVQFTVDLEEGDTVEAAELQVTYNGQTAVLQNIESFPAIITLPALDVIGALGISESEVKVDDYFLYHVVTTNGGISSRSLAALKVFVTCEFDPVLTVGNYHVISDDWGYDGFVTIEADPSDPYKLYIVGLAEGEGLISNGNNVEININPSDFQISGIGVKTIIADDLEPWDISWGADYSYEPLGGLFKSCDGSFQISFDINVAAGGWGPNAYFFTRVN